ncbi:hypothetical protein Q7P36_010298 [Cladosporium allicinum]
MAATLAHDKQDPSSSSPHAPEAVAPTTQLQHNAAVTIEEYMPALESSDFGKNKSEAALTQSFEATSDAPMREMQPGKPPSTTVSDAEWQQAQHAGRTAGWAAIFYLISTDVLGPYSVPWAMAQMGYGPGISLYAVFGALAGYTGWQLWRMFLQLDSTRHPVTNYSDIAFRIYGPVARQVVNVLQSVQLFCLLGVVIIGNGQGLYQIIGNICYVACCMIWAVLGMVLGQIRTLQKFGWIANFAVWMNVVLMVLVMAAVTHSEPNYEAAFNQNGIDIGPPIAPIVTTASAPADIGFSGQVLGLMQAVFSYGGAMLYCEFMSEMRRPHDFWKALLIAEAFIFGVYVLFGVYVYTFQGQYAVNPANQGVSPRGPLVAGNILYLITGLIAAALYGNIGVKVLYQACFKELLHLPDLGSRKGKWIWAGFVPVYWALAFLLAAAIPNFSALSAFVAALCIMQFTYTFPPLLMLGFSVQRDAIIVAEGEGFDPTTGRTIRSDSGVRRWIRGFLAGRWQRTLYVYGRILLDRWEKRRVEDSQLTSGLKSN